MRRTVILTVLITLASVGADASAAARPGPYFLAPFTVRTNSYTFGQTPSWTRSGGVLSEENDRTGIQQVYSSRLNGSRRRCVTCGRTPGPNGFPEPRPQGDWILYCSYGAQPVHLGNPCLGGYGGDLYVIRPDGTGATRLTAATDPAGGAPYGVSSGVPYDNYHAYWSPDGRHIAWTRDRAFPLAAGGAKWEMLVGDFSAPRGGRPRLTNTRVVGPAYGVYETQHWAPDGSGFLFSAFGPRRSPFDAGTPGWMHQEIYFMRLYGRGASPARPMVTQLTDDLPVYQEQAAFTPDMRDVLFMSNRNTPDGSWYDQVIAAAQRTGFDAPGAGSTGTLQFLADFSDPNFRSDLYMLDVGTHDLRQLTDFHNIVPEFHFDSGYTRVLWSGAISGTDRRFVTRVGTFAGLSAAQRRPSSRIPAPALFGRPITLSRIAPTMAARTGPAASRLAHAAASRPAHAAANTIPSVVASYFALWVSQLKQLGARSGADIASIAFVGSLV